MISFVGPRAINTVAAAAAVMRCGEPGGAGFVCDDSKLRAHLHIMWLICILF